MPISIIFLLILAPSPPPDITPSLFGSVPPSSPTKRSDPTPVIIFGFPPSHSLLIIREYERYGPILEHFNSAQQSLVDSTLHPSPPPEILQGGNWIRITYADPVSAARAVATNGQIIGGAYMIGVIYAPKSQETIIPQTSNNEGVDDAPTANSRTTQSTPGGERKMNVVRGGQSMFAKKEMQRPVGEQVDWGTWIWSNVIGVEKKGNNSNSNNGVVVGGGQSNVVVRALKGLSETVFGF